MNIEKEIKLINDIVKNAILYGDECDQEELVKALTAWIETKGLSDYVIENIEAIDEWAMPQIVEDCI